MAENDQERLKRKLEQALVYLIKRKELPKKWQEDSDPSIDDADYENIDLSLFFYKETVNAFKVRFYNKCASFELLTCKLSDTAVDEDNFNFKNGVNEWWRKYRCCLVDYWNLFHSDQQIVHPECWGCRDNRI